VSYTDSNGNPLTSTPAVSYVYDTIYPRATSMTDGTGTTTYTYNPVPGSGTTTGAARLASMTGPLANSAITYSYDELGRMLGTSINGSANTSSVVYDALSRVTSATNPLGTFGYTYVNQTGRVQSVTYPNGQVTNYSYYPNSTATPGNDDQRLAQIQNLASGGANISTFGYAYNAAGLITSWSKQVGTGSVLTSVFLYDAADQLISAILPTDSAVASRAYAYDPAGNRTREQIEVTTTASSFNTVNQLTAQSAGGDLAFTGTVNEPATLTVGGNAATVDASGLWVGRAAVSIGANSIPLVATDLNGNVTNKTISVTVAGGTARTLTYDLNGNLTDNGAGQTYAWDAANRLISITQGSNTTAFVYNGLGQRVQEKFNGTVIKQWVWNRATPAEERDGSNAVTKRFYGFGEQIGGVAYFFTADHLGSIREMVDSTSLIRARYDYDPYGRITKVSGDLEADFGFTGFYRHQASGLSLALFRAYDPGLGCWLARDPIAENGGINLYGYVGNNPVNRMDVLGLAPGDPYSSRDVAAWNALNDINATSIRDNREYAGNIYKNADGTYSYTAPIPGDETTSRRGPVPEGKTTVAGYHTHGDYADCNKKRTDKAHDYWDSDTFSDPDKINADNIWKIDRDFHVLPQFDWAVSYLGTPSGDFKKYTPGVVPTNAITILTKP
jgi:RHS repeat-associated protein